MRIISFLFIFLFYGTQVLIFGQSNPEKPFSRHSIDIVGTSGQLQGTAAAAYIYHWSLGSSKRWNIGLGARYTTAFGAKVDYTTAGPAKFTRGTDFPFAVVVASQRTENWDTLQVQRPFTHSLNLTFNLAYRFAPNWSIGSNIDLIGATIGRTTSGVFTSNGNTRIDPAVKPTGFNLLLTGDNDRGTLNSEFFIQYSLQKHWQLKGVYQFLFTEYQTQNLSQQAPDGTTVNRFRNKANNVGIGLVYQW